MKLELKHLAPYLPYDVNILLEISFSESDSFTLTSDNLEGVLQYQRKMMLNKLSNVHIEKLQHLFKEFYIESGNHKELIIKYKKNQMYVNINIYYEILSTLLEWHVDIYGLIEQGLAIDINTLNK